MTILNIEVKIWIDGKINCNWVTYNQIIIFYGVSIRTI
jgi:hypothetical protein